MEAYDVLSTMSGISKEKIKEIAKNIHKNNKLLNQCSFHTFNKKVNDKWFCSNCGGYVYAQSKMWYEKGVKHGNSNRNT